MPCSKKDTAKAIPKKTVDKKNTKPSTIGTSAKATIKTTSKKTDEKTTSKKLTPAEKLYQSYLHQDHKFELFCENYLFRHHDKYGDVKIRSKTKDGGLDIVCIKEDDDWGDVTHVYYVQVKNKKIDTKIVRELVGSIAIRSKKYGDENTEHIGVLMTSLNFTADAKKEGNASPYKMKYIDGATLAKEKRVD